MFFSSTLNGTTMESLFLASFTLFTDVKPAAFPKSSIATSDSGMSILLSLRCLHADCSLDNYACRLALP